ncbi:MAG: 23S rRNA (adenine(2503)-C(2))-methyltransferase RlmN [Actinomycetes bacterium]|jgi:23S rRNA (adenine2503-C2)-methyltransferase|nr:23S rRNA (adenine(2503)-C(2))-methyltransferase RlmN [Actinomycetes bacterium]
MNNLFTYGIDEYPALMDSLGQPTFRAGQLARWLWQRDAAGYDAMTDLPKELRARLASAAPLTRAHVATRQVARDGTRKYLLAFADGVSVECVGIPGRDGRLTVCVSTQAGCALGCVFCATGQGGLTRDLLPGEIAEQAVVVGRDFQRRVSHVVTMGQGEPFLNYDATLLGLRIINATDGLGVGARHITLSTAGIIAGIERLANEPEQFTLAVSLHSAIQTQRDELMPGLRGQSLERLHTALAQYYEHTHRRPSLEYTLIARQSDTDAQLDALADFARSLGAHVNLILLNKMPANTNPIGDDAPQRPVGTPQRSTYIPLSENHANEICARLRTAGVEATLRASRGADIDAACGQLAAR